MKYFYDRESDSLYLTLAERRRYRDSVEAAPGVVLDFDIAGRLIGIDLEHASKTVDVHNLGLSEEPRRAETPAAKLDGKSLKLRREELGLTQAELGSELGVSSNTIARWERGELKIEHAPMLKLAIQALNPRQATNAKRRVAGNVARVRVNTVQSGKPQPTRAAKSKGRSSAG